MFETVVLAFISLCLVSSSSYIINDIIDAKADKVHDRKKHRPIASGRLPIPFAFLWFILLLISGITIAWWIGFEFFLSIVILILLMHSYNFYFKNIAFADLSVLSTNFMLRAISGALAISVTFSPWLILSTYILALFLGVGKRMSDLKTLGKNAKKYKKVFEIYTSQLLSNFFLLLAAILFVVYSLYSFLGSPIDPLITMATIPVVFFLIFRYYYFSLSRPELLRDPEKIFLDNQMILGMLIWFLIILFGFYYV